MLAEDTTGKYEHLVALLNLSGEYLFPDTMVMCINKDGDSKEAVLLHLEGRDEALPATGRPMRTPVHHLDSFSCPNDIADFVREYLIDKWLEHAKFSLHNEILIEPEELEDGIQEME